MLTRLFRMLIIEKITGRMSKSALLETLISVNGARAGKNEGSFLSTLSRDLTKVDIVQKMDRSFLAKCAKIVCQRVYLGFVTGFTWLSQHVKSSFLG